MNIAIISKSKSGNIDALKAAFEEKGIKPSVFDITKVGLLTEDDKNSILVANKRMNNFDAVYIEAQPSLSQFVEPLLAQVVEKGIYCPFKPSSFYELSNNGAFFQLLNSAKIPIPKTTIATKNITADQISKTMTFPLSVKTFVKNTKTQSIMLESERSLESLLNSFRSEISMVLLQEFLEGDLFYCVVIGSEVLSAKRKWNPEKFTNNEKLIKTALSEDDKKLALKVARNIGTDIVTVKIINDKIVGIKPVIDFSLFNKALGINIESVIVDMFIKKLGDDS